MWQVKSMIMTTAMKKKIEQHEEHDDDHKEHTANQDDHADEDSDGHGDHDDHEKKQSKTILEIQNEGRKFKLSKSAISTLKLKYLPCKFINKNKVSIPRASLVNFRKEFGVFVHSLDWFELVEVSIESDKKSEYIVSSPTFSNLKNSCEIVVSGVPLLRVAQLEASGEGGQGHAH